MSTVYHIIPAGPRPFYLLIPALAIILAAILILAWTLYGTQRAALTVSAAGLDFQGDIWGKRIPLTAIRGRDARIVDLETDTSLRPKHRRMGTGLPGYASGWFRLHNGEKALLYLTNWRRVVYIPTDLGYSVLASVQQPDSLLQQLRAGPAGRSVP